jgi:chaperonin GroEL
VLRTALHHAASVTAVLVTTEAMVGEKPKNESSALGEPGDMM